MNRPGITLVEVLVAIFIMGIGLLAILVLFPLGALNMARSLKDDRCGTIASNADSLAAATDLRIDANVAAALVATPAGYAAPDPSGPGYPVLVDAYGVFGGLTANAGTNTPVVRVSPKYITNIAPAQQQSLAIDRFFSLLDDLSFDPNGAPFDPNGPPPLTVGALQRQGWYTWSYVLRRPQTSNSGSTNLTVIVYKQRPVQTPVVEQAYSLAQPGNLGDTAFALTWAAPQPAAELRRGSWLMDTTYELKPGGGYAHAQFYRVMSATPSGTNAMQVEVLPPLRDANVQQMVFLDFAAEIFDRGTGR